MPVTYKKIASVTVGSGGAASIDFTNIDGSYTDILVLSSLRSNRAAVGDWGLVSFNGSTADFTNRLIDGDGSAITNSTAYPRVFTNGSGANATASTFGNSLSYIPNYAGSTNKSFSIDYTSENNATESYMGLVAGLWSNTAAITSISITPRVGTAWVQYSTATLYGISKS